MRRTSQSLNNLRSVELQKCKRLRSWLQVLVSGQNEQWSGVATTSERVLIFILEETAGARRVRGRELKRALAVQALAEPKQARPAGSGIEPEHGPRKGKS